MCFRWRPDAARATTYRSPIPPATPCASSRTLATAPFTPAPTTSNPQTAARFSKIAAIPARGPPWTEFGRSTNHAFSSSSSRVDRGFGAHVSGLGSKRKQVDINSHTELTTTEIIYHQPMTVRIKTEACAYTPGCQTTTQLSGTVKVELTAGQGQALCFALIETTGYSKANTPPIPTD